MLDSFQTAENILGIPNDLEARDPLERACGLSYKTALILDIATWQREHALLAWESRIPAKDMVDNFVHLSLLVHRISIPSEPTLLLPAVVALPRDVEIQWSMVDRAW